MKYRLYYTNVASTYVDVEAEDEDEAIDLADKAGLPGLCAHCSGWGQPGVELGEWEPAEDGQGNILDPEVLEP